MDVGYASELTMYPLSLSKQQIAFMKRKGWQIFKGSMSGCTSTSSTSNTEIKSFFCSIIVHFMNFRH